MALHTAVAEAEVTFVDAVIITNNNKMFFSADDRVLIKLLRQRKSMVLKSLLQNFPASHGHCQS